MNPGLPPIPPGIHNTNPKLGRTQKAAPPPTQGTVGTGSGSRKRRKPEVLSDDGEPTAKKGAAKGKEEEVLDPAEVKTKIDFNDLPVETLYKYLEYHDLLPRWDVSPWSEEPCTPPNQLYTLSSTAPIVPPPSTFSSLLPAKGDTRESQVEAAQPQLPTQGAGVTSTLGESNGTRNDSLGPSGTHPHDEPLPQLPPSSSTGTAEALRHPDPLAEASLSSSGADGSKDKDPSLNAKPETDNTKTDLTTQSQGSNLAKDGGQEIVQGENGIADEKETDEAGAEAEADPMDNFEPPTTRSKTLPTRRPTSPIPAPNPPPQIKRGVITLSDVRAAKEVLAEKANNHWMKGLGGGQNKEGETIVQFLYKMKVGQGESE
uniref:Uncharacterized protein n=1 Tax=Kwoniella dejecticola CBS 10117 TaxID=1296121 RepID=A0A1A6A0L1_9TREE|nr:uncharacterized protein I303_05880 [Kwoniella dejecticola CBS 10117]OBR83600.1 hypothetical protein I303_05880 [Kwoniella dejecticola CBS 10117]